MCCTRRDDCNRASGGDRATRGADIRLMASPRKTTQHRRKPVWWRSRERIIGVGAISLGIIVAVVIVFEIVLPRQITPSGPESVPLQPACPMAASIVVQGFSVPAGPVAGYCQAQLAIAADIIAAGDKSSAPTAAEEIAVMTAIGESSLRNVNYGDKAGPDSRGIFQQRTNWGPLANRMNPYLAARAFYGRLLELPGWQSMTPTQAAHIVQGNADADYYTQFYSRAVVLVRELSKRRITLPPSIPSAGNG
jgi:hypothetical protein